MSCPDTTVLVDLTLVLGGSPEETLGHVADCPRCRAELRAAARIRQLGEAEAMRPGFTDAVLEACEQHPREDRVRGNQKAGAGWWAAHVALVGATAFVASVLAGTTAGGSPSPWAPALSILAGVAVAFVQHRTGEKPGPGRAW